LEGSIMPSIISTKTSGGGGIAVTGDTSGVMELASANGTTAVTIDTSQNVGVGTASPTEKLSVNGNISASGTVTGTNLMYLSTDQSVTGQKTFPSSNSGIATATGGLNTIQIFGAGGAAMMTFHRPGAFATYFGIDSDNVLKVGGWSLGGAAYPLLYSGSSTAPGGAPVYACRAWVNFNGTGSVAIRASGNVSSISDNGTGDYTVNFSTGMADANYSVNVTRARLDANSKTGVLNSGVGSGSVRVFTGVGSGSSPNGGVEDADYVFVSVFR
jgi:hypothetical protein